MVRQVSNIRNTDTPRTPSRGVATHVSVAGDMISETELSRALHAEDRE
jgi:hypothetical protein